VIDDCCWVPELVPCKDYGRWKEYEDLIYSIFSDDFISSKPMFKGKKVNIRKHPTVDGREDAFWHLTCCDYGHDGNRDPDLRRCERIKWIRKFIENVPCNRPECKQCDGLLVWSYPYKNHVRVKIMLEDERYIVIVELREEYALLITAYYLDHDHSLRKQMREYAAIAEGAH
jgi:hypothetical protein